MTSTYWTKDTSRQEIITKTQIPNSGNFNLFANYYNLMDKKGLSFMLNVDSDLPIEKLFRRNCFEYLVLEHNNLKELYILPNENITEYASRIITKIENCQNESDFFNLMIEEMN